MDRITLTRQSRSCFAVFVLAAIVGVAAVRTVLADEGGVGFWQAGSYGSLAAVPAEPGWALSLTDYYSAVSAGAGVARAREIRIGGFPVGLSATVNAHSSDRAGAFYVEPSYAFATPVFGGQAAIGVSWSFGRDAAALSGTLTGTLTSGGVTVPFSRSDSLSGSVWGFEDLSPVASLRWQNGVNNWMTYITGNVPVGTYDAARLANLGIGHGAIDVGGAYTYYDEKTGREFSGTLGFTYNLINPSTQYQSGVDMHFDWGASQSLTDKFQVGLVGYVYKQIGCDGGAGARLGCFQSQVAGIGPQFGFSFPVGGFDGYLNLKAYKEFGAENRPDGWNAWLTLELSPPAPAATHPAKSVVAK
jgi:hypothetical protein